MDVVDTFVRVRQRTGNWGTWSFVSIVLSAEVNSTSLALNTFQFMEKVAIGPWILLYQRTSSAGTSNSCSMVDCSVWKMYLAL